MVFNSGDFKNGISFSFRIPPDPPKGATVAAAAVVTAKIENICKKFCDTSILWFSTVGISRTGSDFYLGYPQTLPKALPRGGRLGGGLRPIHHKRSCDISILGLLTVGILKVRQVFLLGYPQTLPRAFLGGGGGWLGPIHNKR